MGTRLMARVCLRKQRLGIALAQGNQIPRYRLLQRVDLLHQTGLEPRSLVLVNHILLSGLVQFSRCSRHQCLRLLNIARSNRISYRLNGAAHLSFDMTILQPFTIRTANFFLRCLRVCHLLLQLNRSSQLRSESILDFRILSSWILSEVHFT